ncbi:unnamed protein product [Nippostrongylus brasiliensis]|uniref:Bromo domain-containing protein n=1 Tax=Nippostrongylus brasiliensis TaxID=27835 RepID=A0A0N4YBB0_NIPBR|nr:unnamed protein product [Nippostrongylus brasiliensis]
MTEPQPMDHQPRTPGRAVSKKVSILLMHEHLTEEQIRERLLSDVSEERKEPKWCPLSEARLLQLMVNFKPIGVKKFWNLFSIHKYMHHIYAYESGVNMFLNDINVKSYASILHCAPEDREERYEPIYSIRPTISQILEKISTWYNLALAEHCEELPPEYTEESDFALPESFFVEETPISAEEPTQEAAGVSALQCEGQNPEVTNENECDANLEASYNSDDVQIILEKEILPDIQSSNLLKPRNQDDFDKKPRRRRKDQRNSSISSNPPRRRRLSSTHSWESSSPFEERLSPVNLRSGKHRRRSSLGGSTEGQRSSRRNESLETPKEPGSLKDSNEELVQRTSSGHRRHRLSLNLTGRKRISRRQVSLETPRNPSTPKDEEEAYRRRFSLGFSGGRSTRTRPRVSSATPKRSDSSENLRDEVPSGASSRNRHRRFSLGFPIAGRSSSTCPQVSPETFGKPGAIKYLTDEVLRNLSHLLHISNSAPSEPMDTDQPESITSEERYHLRTPRRPPTFVGKKALCDISRTSGNSHEMARFSEVLKSVQLSSTFSKALLENQLKETFSKSSKDSPQASKASAENATYSSGRDRKSRSGQDAETPEKPRKRRETRPTKTREDSKETSGDR